MHPLLIGILAANCGIIVFDIYLRTRQWKVVYSTTRPPQELNGGASVVRIFDRIRFTTLRRTELAILYCTYKLIQVIALLYYYYPSWLWSWTVNHVEARMWQPIAYVVEESIISDISRLPLNLIIFLEIRRTLQNHKTMTDFFTISIGKMFLKGAGLGLATYYTALALDMFGGNLFLWCWFISLMSTVILVPIYIEQVIPLLDEYTRLSSGSLKEKLESLANEVNFPLSNIYISLGNHADADHVAYFTGIFNSKVIVISFTLITTMSEEEVVAIVAHEMGHWKLGHAWYYLISRAFYNLCLCLLLRRYYDSADLYDAFNIQKSPRPHPVLSFILMADYLLPPFDRVLSMCGNYITRLCEYEADQFAKHHGQEVPLKSALVKIYTQKLIFPVNDELYSIFYLTHPSILERVRAIQR